MSNKKEQITLNIEGMTCAACSARIETNLNKLDGVDATVNLTMNNANIRYDEEQTSVAELKEAIERLGYNVIEKTEINTLDYLDKSAELLRMKRKLIISVILALPLLYSMFAHFGLGAIVPDILLNPWLQWTLATPVQFYIGFTFYKGAYFSLKNRYANMDVLIALGTSAAYFYSVYNVLSGNDHLYFETSAILITLVLLGKYLEALTRGQTYESIQKLFSLRPDVAYMERDNLIIEIPITDVRVGDTLIVRPGERVPLDGTITSGFSSIDESMISGESIPVDKKIGDEVIGGTINNFGSFQFTVTRVGEDTVLAQIIQAVADATGSKPEIQRLADRISNIFVPTVIGLALLTFLIHYIFVTLGDFERALLISISVLVISCPCALGLATPTSIMVGTGKAAEYGILFKNAETIENVNKITAVVFDKTGTLTKGTPQLTDYQLNPAREQVLLQAILSVESYSEHPIGQAVVDGIREMDVKAVTVQNFAVLPRQGVRGTVNGAEYNIGTRALMRDLSIDYSGYDVAADKLESQGKTVFMIAEGTTLQGIIAVSDTVKEDSQVAIERLQADNIEVYMLTGDNRVTAGEIARQVGISENNIIAEVLPVDKAKVITILQESGHYVAMVGDGINDAPALIAADVGIAIGSGTEIAIEASDITLIHGSIKGVLDAITVSKRTLRNIKQNLFASLIYNILGIPLAAIGLLSPIIAGVAMSLSSVSVVLNSLRLKQIKLDK